jgi:hypothetical protein
MSLPMFANSVRLAASFLSPEAWEDPAHPTPEDRTRARELADIWLTPATVQDYWDADFAWLPSDQRVELGEAVAAFRAIADAVSLAGPVSDEQVEGALPALLTFVKFVQPYIAFPEAITARRAIWQAWVPNREWIPAFDFRLEDDWTGISVIRVWLILNAGVDVDARDTQVELNRVRDEIRNRLDDAGIWRRPLITVFGREEVVPMVLAKGRA